MILDDILTGFVLSLATLAVLFAAVMVYYSLGLPTLVVVLTAVFFFVQRTITFDFHSRRPAGAPKVLEQDSAKRLEN